MLPVRFAAATLVAALLPVTVHADAVIGACAPTSVKFAASDARPFAISSDVYADLPQAKIAFRQGGLKAGCVVVRFSAEANGHHGNVLVRALLDGAEGALPSEMIVSDFLDIGPAARRFTFILPSVAPGPHTITIQHRIINAAMAEMNAHNTIVWFAP